MFGVVIGVDFELRGGGLLLANLRGGAGPVVIARRLCSRVFGVIV